jgi:hypothetical protein
MIEIVTLKLSSIFWEKARKSQKTSNNFRVCNTMNKKKGKGNLKQIL